MNASAPAPGDAEPAVARAVARLARAELGSVVDELFRRYAAASDVTPVRLTLSGLTSPTRQALADLLGADRLPPARVSLSVARLCAALGLADATSLRRVVASLRGSIPDRRGARGADRAARDQLWDWLAAAAGEIDLGTGSGNLGGWVDAQRAAGVRGSVAAHRTRLEAALRVLLALPVADVSLAAFASDHAGDPHALDNGRSLAGMVLGAVAAALDLATPDDAESARTTWEAVGVVPDPVSSTVLVLGLPSGGGAMGRWLSSAASASEPVVLTLANLRRWLVSPLPAGSALFVVENPSLAIEAAASGWSGPPIVCSSGRPSVAVVTLLRQLTAEGATAFQHADIDPAGLSITAWLTRRAGTVPWRMDCDDYLRLAVGEARMTGVVPETPWDPKLRDVIANMRIPVYEEQARVELLDAMRRRSSVCATNAHNVARG